MRRNQWDEPILTIDLEGHHDIYRLARALERAQVEFAVLGRKMLAALDRQHPGLVDALTRQMGPSEPGRNMWKQYR